MTNGSPGSVVEGLETGGNDLIAPGGMDPDGDPRLTATGRVAARPVGVLIQGLTGQVGRSAPDPKSLP